MILPNKHIREEEALIGVGAILLKKISSPILLSKLWEQVKDISNVGNYERFILGLDLLFLLGLVKMEDNHIKKNHYDLSNILK